MACVTKYEVRYMGKAKRSHASGKRQKSTSLCMSMCVFCLLMHVLRLRYIFYESVIFLLVFFFRRRRFVLLLLDWTCARMYTYTDNGFIGVIHLVKSHKIGKAHQRKKTPIL